MYEGAISHYFSQSDFDRVALLANMSTGDDFGPRFTADRILNRKKPANFMLDYPTEAMYLDADLYPVFESWRRVIEEQNFKTGFKFDCLRNRSSGADPLD